MNTLASLGIVAILGLLVYVFLSYESTEEDSVKIVAGSYPGDQENTYSNQLPRSFNQPEGAVYSYTGWILIKDFETGYGRRRNILSKDDAPGISIDATSNSLVFSIKTYGTTETILIPNIPAMKWMHVALVVDQDSVDVYINGTLRQHHTLGQLPKQVDSPIKMGGGWSGVLGNVTYYPRALTYDVIKSMSKDQPPSDLYRKPGKPQYFDISWYIGRLNSA
jgi:hypothetical protein